MNAARDWTNLPLDDDGRSLIEASAGTGKTWTISVLYLRLLLERGLLPTQIVVSTFTKAAAAELAERLRGRLLWALAVAETRAIDAKGDDAEPADRAWLRARWQGENGEACRHRDVQRLQAALAQLDAAPITTLHALCTRILADHPFAAGALFRSRAMIDGQTLEAALADDLWRVISQGEAGLPLVELAREAGIDRAKLAKYLPVLLKPEVVVLDATAPARLAGAIAQVVGDGEALTAWGSRLQAVTEASGLLNARGKLQKAWQALAAAIASGADPATLAGLVADHQPALRDAGQMKGINKAGQADPDVQALAAQSAALAAALSPLDLDLASALPLRRFLAAARDWCLTALQARLDAAGQSTFDQLLYSVRDALAGSDGRRDLADALHRAWPVALVDEFQDTDPVQFGILDAIYRDATGAPRGRLVMIGDPKQAIYRFRGGDIQAYERAKASVPEPDRLTLDTNHRSSRGYVAAVNAFYAATGEVLGPKDAETPIRYQPVQASGRRDDTPLREAGSGAVVARPLVIHTLQDVRGDSAELEWAALKACAGQIVHALSADGYRIGEAALQPGDIAVLLPNHAQITQLAALLKARGVPCVATTQSNVFATPLATELRLLLHAVLHAEDPRALRAALATRLLGGRLAELQALAQDAADWEGQALRFHQWHALLERRGPLAVVAALLDAQAPRLLDSVQGERWLTDLRHLGELLQEAWDRLGGGERLMAWLADQMRDDGDGDGDAGDARALRLESDAARVKLMTLHASKGLEFGVVFLPLMWKHTRSKLAANGAQWLSADDGRTKYLVEGPCKEAVKAQEFEERFRILYVALTRAIHACHVFALGPTLREDLKNLKDVPLNTLDMAQTGADVIEQRPGWDACPHATWQASTGASPRRIARPLPAPPPGPLPRRHSFSSLVGGALTSAGSEELAAADEALDETPAVALDAAGDAGEAAAAATVEAESATATAHRDLDALATIAGADFGNAVHAIFEHRQPGQALTAQRELVRSCLQEFGVRPRQGEPEALETALTERLQAVLETPLDGAAGPRLLDLGGADMRAEMEFNYRLDGVSLRALRQACSAHGEPALVPPREDTLAGLMNGKIDLVFAHDGRFHVLDYKSNDLAHGPRPCLEDYAPAAVEAKMRSTYYRFQALLYMVALERYLRERLGPEYRRARHLGDAWYLFVRATGLRLPDGTPCGVWRHRFDDGLLDAVQAVLGMASDRAGEASA